MLQNFFEVSGNSYSIAAIFGEVLEHSSQRKIIGLNQNLLNNLEKASVVAASLIQTLSWQNRQAKFITRAEPGIMDDVLLRLIPLIGADKLIEKIVNEAS